MFGRLVIFGQLWEKPWYGKNAGRKQSLSTSPHHLKLTGCHLLSVPRPIAAPRPPQPRSTWALHPSVRAAVMTKRHVWGPHDARPFTPWLLPQTIAGMGSAEGNFHGPAGAILAQDGVDAHGEIGGKPRRTRRERFAAPRRVAAAGGGAPHHDAPDALSGSHGVPQPAPGVYLGPHVTRRRCPTRGGLGHGFR
jgi:hypothetical protein